MRFKESTFPSQIKGTVIPTHWCRDGGIRYSHEFQTYLSIWVNRCCYLSPGLCVKPGFAVIPAGSGHFHGVVRNMKSLWTCLGPLCLRLVLAWRGRKDRSERSGLMLAGRWARGPVASHCHHTAALARFWQALLFSLVPGSHPPSSLGNATSSTASARRYVDVRSGNSLELICCSF